MDGDRSAYHREYREVLKRLGRLVPIRQDPAPVREHVLELGRQGVGYKKVAAAAGMSTHTLTCILNGTTKTVTPSTAQRVLAVSVASALDGESRVDATQARRDMQALLDLGYSTGWVAKALGYAGGGVQFLRHDRVRKRNADALHNLRLRVGDLPYLALHNMTTYDQSLLSLELADMIEETRRRLLYEERA